MEPKAIDLQQLAIVDPVAAYGIFLGIPRVPFSASMTGVFPTLQVGTTASPYFGPATGVLPLDISLDAGAIAQRTWIDNINYSLYVPQVFPNQVFKTQFDAFLKQSPGITVKLEVQGGPKYLISPSYTPLENLVNLIRSDLWPAGWPLYKQQTLQGFFQLIQSPGGVPAFEDDEQVNGSYYFTLTFNGWQFLDYTVDNMDPKVCADKLRQAGVLLTKPISC